MTPTHTVNASDLLPGDMVDIPERYTAGTDNEHIQPYEYGIVESVNGGWADMFAGPGEVVVYVPNWCVPLVIPADATVTLIERG